MYTPGTKVKINEEGHDQYGKDFMNPADTIGVVIERPSFLPEWRKLDPQWTWVIWEGGVENSYQAGTLEIVEG